MSGTIIINSQITYDVRTSDFVYIINALRDFTACEATVQKWLYTVDCCGINMILADALDPAE